MALGREVEDVLHLQLSALCGEMCYGYGPVALKLIRLKARLPVPPKCHSLLLCHLTVLLLFHSLHFVFFRWFCHLSLTLGSSRPHCVFSS